MKLENVKIEKIESLYQDAVLVTTTDGVQIEVEGEWGVAAEDFDENGHFIYNADENGDFLHVEPFYAVDTINSMSFHNCTKNGYDKLYNECLWAPDDPDYSGFTEECSLVVADAIVEFCKDLERGIGVIFWDYEEKRKAFANNGSEDDNARKNVGLSELCGEQKPLAVSEAVNDGITAKSKDEKVLNMI